MSRKTHSLTIQLHWGPVTSVTLTIQPHWRPVTPGTLTIQLHWKPVTSEILTIQLHWRPRHLSNTDHTTPLEAHHLSNTDHTTPLEARHLRNTDHTTTLDARHLRNTDHTTPLETYPLSNTDISARVLNRQWMVLFVSFILMSLRDMQALFPLLTCVTSGYWQYNRTGGLSSQEHWQYNPTGGLSSQEHWPYNPTGGLSSQEHWPYNSTGGLSPQEHWPYNSVGSLSPQEHWLYNSDGSLLSQEHWQWPYKSILTLNCLLQIEHVNSEMSTLMIMSPPFRVGRHIVFARVVCLSICVHHKIISIEQFKLLGSSNLYPKTLYTIVLVFKQHVLRRKSVTICINTKHQSIAKHFHVIQLMPCIVSCCFLQ